MVKVRQPTSGFPKDSWPKLQELAPSLSALDDCGHTTFSHSYVPSCCSKWSRWILTSFRRLGAGVPKQAAHVLNPAVCARSYEHLEDLRSRSAPLKGLYWRHAPFGRRCLASWFQVPNLEVRWQKLCKCHSTQASYPCTAAPAAFHSCMLSKVIRQH